MMDDELKRLFERSKAEIGEAWRGSDPLWRKIEISLESPASPWRLKVLIPAAAALFLVFATVVYYIPSRPLQPEISQTDPAAVLDDYLEALAVDDLSVETEEVAAMAQGGDVIADTITTLGNL